MADLCATLCLAKDSTTLLDMPPERTPRGWGYGRRVSRTDPQEAATDDSTSRLSPATALCCSRSFGIRRLGAISDSSSGSSSVGRIWIEIDEAIEAARSCIARAQDGALGAAEVTPMSARAEGSPTRPGVLPGMTARGGFEYPATTSVPPSRLETLSPGRKASMQKVRDFQNLVERLQHARLNTAGSGSADNPSRKDGAGARKRVDISEESNLTSSSLLSKGSLLTAVSIPTPGVSMDEGAYQAASDGKKDHAVMEDISTEVAKPKKAKGFNPAAAVFAPAKENALPAAAKMGSSDQGHQIAGQPAAPDAFMNGAPIPGSGIPPGGPLIAIIPPPIIQTPQGQLLPTSPFGVALPISSSVMQTDLSALVAMQQLVVQQTALQAQLAVAGGGVLPMLGQRPPPVAGPALPPSRSGSPVKAAFKPSGPAWNKSRSMAMPMSMPPGMPNCPAAPRPPQVPLAPVTAPRPVVNQDLLKFDARGRLMDVRKPRGHDNPLLQLQYEAAIEWKKANVPGYAEECRRRQNERNERNALRNVHQHLLQHQQHFAQGPHSANMPGRARGDDVA
ncbi:hypothetical protein MAPG_07426 [Magnaporthiopsis poae ATCC 64411]|uniref:Uncharacterized protein n=1 Tax=Magnaporthiopsis poae (strain ATCC 64411 / 73-15) TaxID=644358 RepID=A0A0C4E4M9_MAGP6|nr:hypothetical protein MAPG_07426 [Magnaporthiopsis poae ATCC 64411]